MRKFTATRLITILLSNFIVIIILLNTLIWLTDPLGHIQHYRHIVWSSTNKIEHPTGYSYQDAVYNVGTNTVTIEDGNRITPLANNPTCTIAIIGDSVSFGWGVNDDESYPYILGINNPDVQIINTAKAGYNSYNLIRSIEHQPADHYIYLIVDNDYQAPDNAFNHRHYLPTISIGLYIQMTQITQNFNQQQQQVRSIPDAYYRDTLEQFPNNVTAFAWQSDHPTVEIAREYLTVYDIAPLPRLSFSDPHPNRVGHQIIAATMQPHLADICQETT